MRRPHRSSAGEKPKMGMLICATLLASAVVAAAGCGGGGGASSSTTGGTASKQTITIGWGAEPPSLDPGLATDVTSSNILLNIMDPLVLLGDDLQPVPGLAESW